MLQTIQNVLTKTPRKERSLKIVQDWQRTIYFFRFPRNFILIEDLAWRSVSIS